MKAWGDLSFTLARAMRARGITADKLSEVTGVRMEQLNRYITNQENRPDLAILARICAALDCTAAEILCYTPPAKSAISQGAAAVEGKYSTNQVAKALSVHPNTIRWYEKMGLISPVPRLKNGYSQYDGRHLVQLRVCRLIFGTPCANKPIRASAFEILAALKQWDIGLSLSKALDHRRRLEQEYASALETAAMLKTWTEHKPLPLTGKTYTRKGAADLLGVTTEVLRNWERNGLVGVSRSGEKNEKIYGDREIMRFRIVYMLRQNNYSIAAILHSLSQYDSGNTVGAALALHQPIAGHERVYSNAGDHWLEVLGELTRNADQIMQIIEEIPNIGSN